MFSEARLLCRTDDRLFHIADLWNEQLRCPIDVCTLGCRITSTIHKITAPRANLSALSVFSNLSAELRYCASLTAVRHKMKTELFHLAFVSLLPPGAFCHLAVTAIWRPSKAHGTANQTTHHRRTGIWSCSRARVEQSSARCHFSQLTPVFQKTTENFSF